MATANVVKLTTTAKTARKPRRATHTLRKHMPAAGLGAVILVLLYLSLPIWRAALSSSPDAKCGKAPRWPSGSTC
jgi:hypothetical protein